MVFKLLKLCEIMPPARYLYRYEETPTMYSNRVHTTPPGNRVDTTPPEGSGYYSPQDSNSNAYNSTNEDAFADYMETGYGGGDVEDIYADVAVLNTNLSTS